MEELIDLYTEFWNRPESIRLALRNDPIFDPTDNVDPIYFATCKHCQKLGIQHDHYGYCK